MTSQPETSVPEVSKKVRSSRYIDLDEAVEELEPIEIAFAGKVYIVSGSVDAKVVMTYIRYTDGVIPTPEVYALFNNLVGEQVLTDMLDDGLSMPKLEFLTRWLLEQYGITGAEAEDDGDSPN